MIRDNKLAYANLEPALTANELSNTVLNAVMVALLITLISYQSTALLFDLLFGLKPRGQVSLSTLQIYLLCHESSPLAVISAIFRRDTFTRWRLKGDVPRGTKIARDKHRVKNRTVVRLIIALLAAPVVNILSVLMSLEYEQGYSVHQVGFGGVSVGLRGDLTQVETKEFVEGCEEAVVDVGRMERVEVKFSLCTYQLAGWSIDDGTVRVGLDLFNGMSVSVMAEGGGVGRGVRVQGEFVVECESEGGGCGGKEGLVLRAAVGESEVGELLKFAGRFLGCQATLDQGDAGDGGFQGKAVWMTLESCERVIGEIEVESVVEEMGKKITFLKVEKMEYAEFGKGPLVWVDGADVEFLRRKRRWVSLGWLGVVVGIVVVIRVVVVVLVNNDVGEGVGVLVKEAVGVEWWDSLIREGGKVRFNYKYQHNEGDRAWYGVAREGEEEVGRFVGGIVGADRKDEEESKIEVKSRVDDGYVRTMGSEYSGWKSQFDSSQ